MQKLEDLQKIVQLHIELSQRPGIPENERDYWETWKDQLDYGRPQTRPEFTVRSQQSGLVCD